MPGAGCTCLWIELRVLNLRNADAFDYALKTSIQIATGSADSIDLNDPLSVAKWAALVGEDRYSACDYVFFCLDLTDWTGLRYATTLH